MSQTVNARGAGVATGSYHGTNVTWVSYFSEEFPFLNILKQAGSNDAIPWVTAPTANQSGDIQFDTNGYPASMQGVSGQTFTSLQTLIFVNIPGGMKTGATTYYPPGPYRLQFTGKGTIVLSGGFTTITSISNTGVGTSTFAGLTITSPTTGVTTVMVNTADTSGGLRMAITAIPDVANYPRAMSIVKQSKAAAYDAGAIFSDEFIASLANYSSVRTKDWLATDTEMISIVFGGAGLLVGATSAVNKFYGGSPGVWNNVPWKLATGNYVITFTSGEQVTASCVWNSATITFPALTKAVAYAGAGHEYDAQAFIPYKGDWAHRTKFTDFSWGTAAGVPYEVCWTLSNILNGGAGIDQMWSVPCRAALPTGIDMTYINGLANLMFNGAGTTMPGFTGLKKKAYVEFSNEGWNYFGAFGNQTAYNVACAKTLVPGATDTAGHEYRGAMQALIGDAFFAVFGATEYAKRVWSSYGGQTAWDPVGGDFSWGPYYTIRGMASAHWAGGAAYTHHIDSVHFAPYVGCNGFSAGDKAQVMSRVNPIDAIFALAYTNVYTDANGTITIGSISSSGWVGQIIDHMVGQLESMARLAPQWVSLPRICYESGTDFAPQTTDAWGLLNVAVHTDPRIEFIYYDPSNQLASTYGIASANGKTGYLKAMQTVGFLFMHQLTDVGSASKYGEYGAIDSVLQPLSPLSAAPAKWRGLQKFMLGLSS